MFHYTVETEQSVDEAVQALDASLKKRGFGILWSLDMTATLQSKGQDFTSPYRVLEVCNAIKAKEVLTESSLVGYFLPCKIVVYKEAQTTKIGMPKPTILISQAEIPSLNPIAQEIEGVLIEAIHEAIDTHSY